MPARIADSERAAMAIAYQEGGMTCEQVGKQFGHHQCTVRQILVQMGVPRRPGHRQAGSTLISKEDEASILARYEQGCGLEESGSSTGWSPGAVLGVLKRNGIHVRNASEASRVHPLNERCFASVDTPEKAWLLGFIAADGCVLDRGVLQIALQVGDRDGLHKAAAVMGYGGPVRQYRQVVNLPQGTRCVSNYVALSISSVSIATDLAVLGVKPRKSLTLEPWNGPGHLMWHYWRGMVDGDGSFAKTRRPDGSPYWSVSFCGSQAAVKAFCDFVNRHTGSTAQPRPSRTIWSTSYGGLAMPQKVAAMLYKDSPIHLDRKKALADELMAITVVPPRWAHITAAELDRLHSEFGTWAAVSRHLGMNTPAILNSVRHRLGMDLGKPSRWAHLTVDVLRLLYLENGSNWSAVSRRLGMNHFSLLAVRRRLGMM